MALRVDNLVIPQGATWEVRWPLQNTDGTPVDTTGWDLRAHARPSVSSTVILMAWSTADGSAVFNNGSACLKVAPETSAAWAWRSAHYDVEMFHSDGRVVRLTQGVISLDLETTR